MDQRCGKAVSVFVLELKIKFHIEWITELRWKSYFNLYWLEVNNICTSIIYRNILNEYFNEFFFIQMWNMKENLWHHPGSIPKSALYNAIDEVTKTKTNGFNSFMNRSSHNMYFKLMSQLTLLSRITSTEQQQ